MDSQLLLDKVVIVTGGSGLIGKAIVENIRKKGGTAICSDINVDTNLDRFELNCDITNLESIHSGIRAVNQHFGRIDGLVNNAYPRTEDWGLDFEEIAVESLQKNVNWQLNSYMIFCQQIIPYLRQTGGGSIVNIASIYGVVGNDFSIYDDTDLKPPAAYTAIKGGIINFTKYLASKYGGEKIRVNCVSPGGVFDHQPEVFVNNYNKKVPLKRMATPQDIAPSISFLLSDEAGYITGHNLIVDGGWTAI